MEAVLEASVFKKLVDCLKDILSQTELLFDETGFSVGSMDDSHIAYVEIFLDSDYFEKYRCEKPFSIGVNLDTFAKVLKSTSAGDTLTISYEEKHPDVITFSISPRNSEFTIKLLDIEQQKVEIPRYEDYLSVVKIPSVSFQKNCTDLAAFGDVIKMETMENIFEISCSGDLGDAKIKFSEGADAVIRTKPGQKLVREFALKFLIAFNKASSLDKTVELYFNKNAPLIITFNIGKDSFIRYFLAPKAGDDDEDKEDTMND